MADANATKGQPENRQPEDTGQTPDARPATGRIVLAVALFVLAAAVVVIIFWLRSDSLTLNVLLVVATAVLVGLASVALPIKLRDRSVPFAVVAAGTAGLLATVLAIPNLASKQQQQSPDDTDSDSPAPTTSPTPTTTPTESDPFTAKLKFGPLGSACEGLVVHEKLLRKISKMEPKDVDAKWAYGNGGATHDGKMILTIQGRSGTAVVINALRVVDFERHPAPAHNVEVLPCDPEGGLQSVRYFDVNLAKRPRVIPRPSDPDPNPDYKQQPAAKFPFKVSKSDPEVFELWVSGPDCLCTWRLAIDWTSGDRSDTTYLDHGFDKIRTITDQDQDLPGHFYDSQQGWTPPLPK